jgi:hypothetical protein
MTFSQFEQPALPRPSERHQASIATRGLAKAVRAQAAYLRTLSAVHSRKAQGTASLPHDPLPRPRQ